MSARTTLRGYGSSLLLGGACVVVGVLAAFGRFNSMMGFPLIFGGVCAALGLLALLRPGGPRSRRAAIVLVGAAVAVGGWLYQGKVIRQGMAEIERQALTELEGRPAPRLVGLEPLDTAPDDLAAAASFTHAATIVSFWATWCSPCWAEMAELQELWESHRTDGLAVVALTSYDHPDSEEGRDGDRANAEAFLRQRGFEYPAAITADGDNYRAFAVRSIPSTALVDGEGRIVDYAVGLASARRLMARAEAMVSGG